jgi:hypothetical protein
VVGAGTPAALRTMTMLATPQLATLLFGAAK